MSKITCVIVHGCPSSRLSAIDPKKRTYDKQWMPWLRRELKVRGIESAMPLMPNPWAPDYIAFKTEFDKTPVDENTILIGHSCGTSFLLRWLGETKRKVKKLILVAPWRYGRGTEKFRKTFYGFEVDPSIKERAGEIVMFTSPDEEKDGLDALRIYHEILGGKVVSLPGHGHYTEDDMGTAEFPELLLEVIGTFEKTAGSADRLSYSDYISGTKNILDESKKEKKQYEIEISGRKFIVFPNVFSPKYFHDTALFADNLPIRAGDEVLEIGPGTGIVSISAVLRGAKKVTAIEINPDAIDNTRANVRLHHLEKQIDIRHGDVFSALLPGECYDVIFWNTPFGFVDDEHLSHLEKSVFDHQYKSTEKFIKEASRYLKPGGRVYVGFSSTLGRMDLLDKFASESGMDLVKIFEAKSSELYPVKFEIFWLKRSGKEFSTVQTRKVC